MPPYPTVWPFSSSSGRRKAARSGNGKRIQRVYTGSEANSEAVAHGRYFEVPTFSRWSLSLSLTLSTHPRSSSPRISLLPSFAFNHARILSIPRLISTQETFSRLHFFSGQTRSSKSVAISRLLSHLQFQLADFSNSDPYFTRTILARTVVDPTENCSTCYFRWRIASFLFSFFFAGTAVCAVTFTELVLILSRLDRPSFVFSLR